MIDFTAQILKSKYGHIDMADAISSPTHSPHVLEALQATELLVQKAVVSATAEATLKYKVQALVAKAHAAGFTREQTEELVKQYLISQGVLE